MFLVGSTDSGFWEVYLDDALSLFVSDCISATPVCFLNNGEAVCRQAAVNLKEISSYVEPKRAEG